jgi:hypothetical protein
MKRSLEAHSAVEWLNMLLLDRWWNPLFVGLLLLAFVSTAFHAGQGGLLPRGLPLAVVVGLIGLTGVCVSLLMTLLVALFLAVLGWFFSVRLPYRILLRIAAIDLLIRLLLGLPFLPQTLPWKILIECLSCLYLSPAIWAALPWEQRRPLAFIVGIIPSLFALVMLLA